MCPNIGRLPFGISWSAWIIVIKLQLGEGFLYLGSAGPAFSPMILCRNRREDSSQPGEQYRFHFDMTQCSGANAALWLAMSRTEIR
jgi:hypothetical protein